MLPAIAPEKSVSVEDMVTGFMRYGHAHGVLTYPDFHDESWHLLLRATQDAVPGSIPRSICLEFDPPRQGGSQYPMLKGYKKITAALAVLAPTDRATGRMRLKLESQSGIEMTQSFLGLIEVMFVIGWRIDGFYALN